MNLNPIKANMTELDMNGMKVLFSYRTPVAVAHKMTANYVRVERSTKKWSNTTTRHVNAWIKSMAEACIVVDLIGDKPQEYFDNLIAGVK